MMYMAFCMDLIKIYEPVSLQMQQANTDVYKRNVKWMV